MSDALRARVVNEFHTRFGAAPEFVARAPGRVNLIGDHTDYNDGFVLPMAIDRAVWIAFRSRTDGEVVVHSLDFGDVAEFDVQGELSHSTGWQEYVRGVAWALADAGSTLHGWEGVAAGDVPLGAGLSSSAALELATARVFASASSVPWAAPRMALLAQRAENRWVGVNCGIMDQLISAAGVAGHALLIDCRSLATRAVVVPHDAAVVVLDTATRRGLVDSEYNERRERCEAAARYFGVKALRDVDDTMFNARADGLDDVTRRRARHVIGENLRTRLAAAALERGDVKTVGRLMDESHASLRDDFAVSRRELDVMVTIAREHDGCYGARMTGAGFGGCAVALVRRDAADAFARDTAQRYERAVGLVPAVYVCAASAGASVEPA
ncbi:MAG: galK [Gemmatimonadetes bacterium]|nr:galK [Gemmatimonadota bacterium]